jgi:hypothetical protein
VYHFGNCGRADSIAHGLPNPVGPADDDKLRVLAAGNRCPACKSDSRGIVITPAKNLFYCFSAKEGGDQIALAAHVRDCTTDLSICVGAAPDVFNVVQSAKNSLPALGWRDIVPQWPM